MSIPTIDVQTKPDLPYAAMLDAVKRNLATFDMEDNLFIVDVEKATGKTLFQHYLSMFSDEERQGYNCRSCERWLNKYGCYVVGNPDGTVTPVAFTNGEEDQIEILAKLANIISRAPIHAPVFDNERDYAVKHNGQWRHFEGSVQCDTPALISVVPEDELEGKVGAARTAINDIVRWLGYYTDSTWQKVAVLFDHGELKGADKKHKAAFAQAYELYKTYSGQKNNVTKRNAVWAAYGIGNISLAHFANTVVGNLLGGVNLGDIYAVRKFITSTSGENYMRPTEAPTEKNVADAEKLIDDLGLTSALKRRFADYDDILEFEWQPAPTANAEQKGGVFGDLKTKDGVEKPKAAEVNRDLGILEFVNDILKEAVSIEVTVPYGAGTLLQLSTQADPEAKPILRYDSEEKRNPVSIYTYTKPAAPEQWGLRGGRDYKVNGIITIPDAWTTESERTYGVAATGYVFLVEGAKEQSGEQSALFPQLMRHELYPVRSVIEAYSARTPMGEVREGKQSAAGIHIGPNHVQSQYRFKATLKSGVIVNCRITHWL